MNKSAKNLIVYSLASILLIGVGAPVVQAAPQTREDQKQEEQRSLDYRGKTPAMGNNLTWILVHGKVQKGELAIARFASNRNVFLNDQPMKLGQTQDIQPDVRKAALQARRIK